MNTGLSTLLEGPCSWVPGSRAEPAPGNDLMNSVVFIPEAAPRPSASRGSPSDEEPLLLQPVIEVGHKVAVAVPFKGRHTLVSAEHPLGGLAPARMGNFRVDVRPEAVLAPLHGFPEGHRALFGKREVNDRFDRFETVFPWQYQP